MRGWRPPSPRGLPALGLARLGLGQQCSAHPALASGLCPRELTPSICSFFSGHSCSNVPCKDLSGSGRRQTADEGWCPSLGGLRGPPGAPWHGDRGPRADPGGKASVCAGGHAPGRADGSLGTMPTLPFHPPPQPACRAGAQLLSPPQSRARAGLGEVTAAAPKAWGRGVGGAASRAREGIRMRRGLEGPEWLGNWGSPLILEERGDLCRGC